MNQTSKTLRPRTSTTSRLKTSLMLVVSVLFVACGIWMLPDEVIKGSFIIAFFGLCVMVFIVQLLPGSSWLRLDENGFTYCALFRTHHVRWQDVESFTLVRVGVNDLVGWNHVKNYESADGGRQLNRALVGVDASLPDNYGMSANTLAELMNSYIRESRRVSSR